MSADYSMQQAKCMAHEVKLAQFGMGMSEGTPLRWLKKEGDMVREGEPIVEIEAAKAVVEVPSPASGKLTKILAAEGTTVPVYSVIALID
jgi:pyruvate/2-oxoglutarate dehydrogenase complex dihydrolipoamide acyltransferase (E2) component